MSPRSVGHLADDPRVVRGVRRGGDERRELVDADAATRILELAFVLRARRRA
jgi:hypothetical protein